MNIFVYANCQGIAVKKFLPLLIGNQAELRITNVENYIAIGGGAPLTTYERALKESDIFIYQPIAAGHDFYSTVAGKDNIVSLLRPGCDMISFPYIYNDGLWPCFLEEEGTRNGEVFDEYLMNGASADDIFEMYDGGKLRFNLNERLANSLDVLRQREATCDTKFADFILQNLRIESLFNVQCHPSSACFYELARQLAALILGKSFAPQTRRDDIPDRNLADLPGYYPIDRYCLEELNFPYFGGKVEDGAGHFYKSVIHEHCRRWFDKARAA